MTLLSKHQKQMIHRSSTGTFLRFFLLWILLFTFINGYYNEIYVVGLAMFQYPRWIWLPYIFFTSINTLLIALSINLIILKFKEIKKIRPDASMLSLLGTFVTLLTGACPGCIAGIFPLVVGFFGSTITLYSLPLYGIELQILSCILLLVGIYYTSRSITCNIHH